MEHKKHEILLGLTTTPRSDWRKKIKQISEFKIKKIALFPTFMEIGDRKVLYGLLEKTDIEEIPHVHLRHDMEEWELEMFIQRYKTKVFNIHGKHFAFYKKAPFDKYLNMIFIENQFYRISKDCLDMCGGLCLDFTHWESARLKKSSPYEMVAELASEYKIGCCHVAAIKGIISMAYLVQKGGRDWHYLKKNKEVDYLKKYKQYLPEYISLELENDFEKQLEVKKYIEENILIN